jgi:hypothetical protein
MKDFIQPPRRSIQVSQALKLDVFVSTFNKSIARGKFSLNTGLDKIPRLTPEEYTKAKIQAIKNGYNLTYHEDNYQTVTYKLEPLK